MHDNIFSRLILTSFLENHPIIKSTVIVKKLCSINTKSPFCFIHIPCLSLFGSQLCESCPLSFKTSKVFPLRNTSAICSILDQFNFESGITIFINFSPRYEFHQINHPSLHSLIISFQVVHHLKTKHWYLRSLFCLTAVYLKACQQTYLFLSPNLNLPNA